MFKKQMRLPSAEEVITNCPLPESLRRLKEQRDMQIKQTLLGESNKVIVIVGPCSAHSKEPVLEYMRRLGKLNEEVKDRLVIIPRLYSSKPRSLGVGYKGMFYQPTLGEQENILEGIYAVRRLNIATMELSGLSCADEMLYPSNYAYVADLLSYVSVGARSCEDQLHRFVASGIDGAVGIKNPTNGNLQTLLNSIYAAQNGQVFKMNGWQVATDGNLLTHAILRGYTNQNGEDIPNYTQDKLNEFIELYMQSNLQNQSIIIDCNHSNSGKNCQKQVDILKQVLNYTFKDNVIKKYVKGFMIESFIEEGNQSQDIVFGKSITDPCLGWEDTKRLLLYMAENVK